MVINCAHKNNSLDSSVQYLKGVGDKRAKALANVDVHTIRDLLYYFPRRYLDRTTITPIKNLKKDQLVTVVGKVASKGIQHGRSKTRFVIQLTDNTGILTCVWFHRQQYWNKIFETGETLAVSGKVGYFAGYQMIHPEFDRLSDDNEEDDNIFINTGIIVPLYPSTEILTKIGMDSRGFRRIIRIALKSSIHHIHEKLSQQIIAKYNLISLQDAIQNIHFPENNSILENAKQRLKFDELFFLEMMLAYRKRSTSIQKKGIEFKIVGEKTKELAKLLPFELTEDQKKVLRQIRYDMKKSNPMFRLLQGDVGSGKTIVSLISMLIAVENGYQTALMAPTEVLAEQHFLTTRRLLAGLDVKIELLIGAQNKAERTRILSSISDGTCDVVIGTHALIQKDVNFSKLGLVVIDEQHRFGVTQRASLMHKGTYPDVLVMTATPIPRTLSLTIYGDLDISVINQLPKGRKPVKTYWRNSNLKPKIYQFVKDNVVQGKQAYIIFPLVDESEKIDLQAATENYEEMSKGIFSEFNVALLHGKMKSEEKDQVMTSFKNGEIDILISTTVIEVGVDVANASIIIIEHAERFGLTQLHQLRGRVGRGSEQSYCILIAYYPLSDEAVTRLRTMVDTTDGFKIAEVDLKLRGPGEFFGTRQHGMPELTIANPINDVDILIKTRNEAFHVVENDPQLLREENQNILHHFNKYYREKLDLIRIG